MTTHTIVGGRGLKLNVQETGNRDGRPILFIHGFSQSRLAWTRQMRSDLAEEFRLVAMDIRGHGLSEKPPGVYGDPRLWAEDVHAVITTLNLDKPILSGWSYGGVIMSDYLGVYGEDEIAGTQWVGAVSRLGDPLVQGAFLGAEFLALVPGFFSERVVESAEALERFLRLCVHHEPSPEDFYLFLGYNSVVPPYVREGLFTRSLNNDPVVERLCKPVLLIHGERDRIVSPRMCAHLAKLARDAEVSMYPDVGHMPFWEAPDRFNRELRSFSERVWSTRSPAPAVAQRV